MASESVQDYLKTIFKLSRDQESVSTSSIAARLDVAPASVTKMVKRLADEGYLRHAPYQGVALTEAGERIALRTIRHHRLLELYLTRALGFPWDLVDAEAERLEHVISEEMESRIDAALGYPTVDPHGHAIPCREGTLVAEEECTSLAEAEPGMRVRVRRVDDVCPDVLRHLGHLGLYPGAVVVVHERLPFGGHLRIEVQGHEAHIGSEPAGHVFVAPA
jgi:DtxR family Mn-dependent transcriptional regulator